MWQRLLLFYPEIDLTFAGQDKSHIRSQKNTSPDLCPAARIHKDLCSTLAIRIYEMIN